MSSSSRPETPAWLASAVAWLNPRRLHAQAAVLALCLWGVCAVDFATHGIFDRAGNIKFQDFLQFPIAARLIAQGRAAELYDDQFLTHEIRAIVGRETTVHLQYFYGPQVGALFLPLDRLSFLAQAGIWVTLSMLIYFSCVYLLWKDCRGLSPYPGLVALCALAYPPLFHFFVRGQVSALALACFTAALLAFRFDQDWLAGIALGLLVFKPQFLVAVPLVLLLAQAWKALAGVLVSAGTQIALTFIYFGPPVMRPYLSMLLHSAGQPGTTELSLSPIQMHSLHTFWELLIPWPRGVWALYLLSALAVVGMAAAVWKSSSPLALRFSALTLAAVLLNPHIYIYDLLVLAPVLLLVVDWSVSNVHRHSAAALLVLSYLAFLLPLFGPLARWTHLQLSVPIFAALLWTLWRQSAELSVPNGGRSLATPDSRVV